MADEALHFPADQASKLEPYLPPVEGRGGHEARPWVLVTYAASLDGAIAAAPGVRTTLSGPESKAMTHYLRTRHDAICVGVGTAEADDPGLNSRLAPAAVGGSGTTSQPRPVVLDPRARWAVSDASKVIRLAREGRGRAPFVITATPAAEIPAQRRAVLERCGGKYIVVEGTPDAGVEDGARRFRWADVLAAVWKEGLKSIMIEGGGHVLNSLLVPPESGFVDSVIVTVAPTWLGKGGVVVSPERTKGQDGITMPAPRLRDATWLQMGEDVVLCGRLAR